MADNLKKRRFVFESFIDFLLCSGRPVGFIFQSICCSLNYRDIGFCFAGDNVG